MGKIYNDEPFFGRICSIVKEDILRDMLHYSQHNMAPLAIWLSDRNIGYTINNDGRVTCIWFKTEAEMLAFKLKYS